MVKYVDVLVSTSRMLKDLFPKIKILTETNKQDITKPTFYLEVKPVRNNLVISDKRYKITDLYITYVKKDITNEEKLDIFDELIESFEGINILDLTDKELKRILRYLPIMNKKFLDVEGMPCLKLTFNYYDDRREPIKDNPSKQFEDYMKIIEMNININDNEIHSEVKEDN